MIGNSLNSSGSMNPQTNIDVAMNAKKIIAQ